MPHGKPAQPCQIFVHRSLNKAWTRRNVPQIQSFVLGKADTRVAAALAWLNFATWVPGPPQTP
jgi:hypothetical protein